MGQSGSDAILVAFTARDPVSENAVNEIAKWSQTCILLLVLNSQRFGFQLTELIITLARSRHFDLEPTSEAAVR